MKPNVLAEEPAPRPARPPVPVATHASTRRRPGAAAIGFLTAAVALALAPHVLGGAILPAMVLAGIWGIAAVGLGLLSGRAGQVSLGQAGIVAVGGYAAGYASARWGWPAELALPFAVLVGVLTTAATSPILRLRGLYLATATLALAVIVERLLVALTSLTGGSNGLLGIEPLTLAGVTFETEIRFYYLVWGLAVLGAIVQHNLLDGRFGRALDAIRADEDSAAAAGIGVARHKMGAWLLSGAYAGLAGGVYAYYNLFLSPEQFTLGPSIDLIAAVIVGGAATPLGPLIGVIAIEAVPAQIDLGERVTALLGPVLLVTFASFAPEGILPRARTLVARTLAARTLVARRRSHR